MSAPKFDQELRQKVELKEVCASCGKPVPSNRGSFTAWIFADCKCGPLRPSARAEAAEETATKTAAHDPAKTAAETPAKTAAETPAETAAESPAKTAAETPAETAAGPQSPTGHWQPAAEPDEADTGSILEQEGAQETRQDESVEANLGDRYEVQSLLGRGGMGAVYKVRDRILAKTFAIKVLKAELVEDRSSVKRFEQEARAASALTHPNLVAVYEYGMGKKGCPYLVMDYLEGDNLADIIAHEGFLEAPRVINIFMEAAEAIAHAHHKGVIHRDIKPSNIIIAKTADGADFTKLVDFGIAKVLPSELKATQNLTQTGDIFGSPLYMSPEQCQGNTQDARSDIYSLGCVIYEALTGIPPFAADNPIKTILRHVNEEAAAIHSLSQKFEVPAQLETVVMRCLARDPLERYQSADELIQDLNALREGKQLAIKKMKLAPSRSLLVRPAVRLGVVAIFAGILTWGAFSLFSASGIVNNSLDPNGDAQNLDAKAFSYFSAEQYDKALPLLQFGLATYQDKVTKDKETGAGTTKLQSDEIPLAENLQHIAKCNFKLGERAEQAHNEAAAHDYFEKALQGYRASMKIWVKYGNFKDCLMPEAANGYAQVLRHLNMTSELAQVQSLAKSFKIRLVP